MFSNKGIVKVGQKFGPISENTLKKTEITPKVELFFLFLTYGIETPQSVLHYSSNDTCVEKFNALTCIKYHKFIALSPSREFKRLAKCGGSRI